MTARNWEEGGKDQRNTRNQGRAVVPVCRQYSEEKNLSQTGKKNLVLTSNPASNEGVGEQLRPRQALPGVLHQQPLQEALRTAQRQGQTCSA